MGHFWSQIHLIPVSSQTCLPALWSCLVENAPLSTGPKRQVQGNGSSLEELVFIEAPAPQGKAGDRRPCQCSSWPPGVRFPHAHFEQLSEMMGTWRGAGKSWKLSISR